VGTRVMSQGDSAEAVLEAADRAMFEAKRISRNAVVEAL
jgi:PleD family two-component response regulator